MQGEKTTLAKASCSRKAIESESSIPCPPNLGVCRQRLPAALDLGDKVSAEPAGCRAPCGYQMSPVLVTHRVERCKWFASKAAASLRIVGVRSRSMPA